GWEDDRKNVPPGSKGWPIVGENIEFSVLGPEKFVKDRMEKYSGEVFKTSLLGEKMAVFCGAQGNKFLFTNENKLLRYWFPQSLRKAMVYPESGDGNLKEEVAAKRILHGETLSPEALKQYVPVMDAKAREHMERDWKPNAVVKVLPSSEKYTFELACRALMGVVDPHRVKKLFDPFTLVTAGMVSVPIDLPGTAYHGAIRGGKMVCRELIGIIKERREEEVGESKDLLSRMAAMRDEDGRFSFSEMEISHCFIGLLVASFDTTASAITAIMAYLAELPHIYSL
ncbi:hypothetical protein C2S51_019638, partial [Perilla frutescens var. frutescens]